MFHGSIVALVTPMQANGEIDFKSLEKLVAWHLENSTDAILVIGTTGESPTLTAEECTSIIKQTVKQINGRIPVIAGTGTNSTQVSVQKTKHAMELGVDACLLVTPYYNKPTQEGLYQHFKTIAEAVPVPQILYNVPARTSCDILPETVGRLSKFSNIVGIKDATGKIERVQETINLSNGGIDLYSGDDSSAMNFMLAGGKGVISVAANVVPKLMHELCHAATNKQVQQGEQINQKLTPLYKQLAIQSNPIPVKWALTRMGMIPSGIRLPLTTLEESYHESVHHALRQVDVLKNH